LSSEKILNVRELVKYFPVTKKGIIWSSVEGQVHAVDNVSFSVGKGETLGLVGESGCGKTTVARCILNLTSPTSGDVYFDQENTTEIFRSKNKARILELRRKMQYIFQDPWASLNPRLTVRDLVLEGINIHGTIPEDEQDEKLRELLHLVGLEEYHGERYPHEFSGGQRQRVVIARAIAVNPQFLAADEPVSMVDLSIRAQILNLLQELQSKLNLSILYISHDLASVKHVSDRVAVMYLGKLVEVANSEEIFSSPLHPYTHALLSAVPIPDPTSQKEVILLSGEVPSAIDPPTGCRFRHRCSYAMPKCEEEPLMRNVGHDHLVACWLV
jgi:oligopeptide transport system ATP-binding protein